MMDYKEEDYLKLSGIQHFAFCRRQWALIHIENQWEENVRTVEGQIIHDKAHDKFSAEARGDILISRGMPIYSASLGISGECDVVEFHRSPEGINIAGKDGLFDVVPIEYKRGEEKQDEIDELQLATQAMCLEEMLCCTIPRGYLYYHETRHRVAVNISTELRKQVMEMLNEMHQMYHRGYTPHVKRAKKCNACSLKHICLPELSTVKSVRKYIEEYMTEEDK
jgi:CRISPR-associated exonuclease Cas4